MDGSLNFEFRPFLLDKDLHGFFVVWYDLVQTLDGSPRVRNRPVMPLEVGCDSEQTAVSPSIMTMSGLNGLPSQPAMVVNVQLLKSEDQQ